jgi:hypothetical protein
MRAWFVLVAVLQAGCSLTGGDGRGHLHNGGEDGGTPGDGGGGGATVLARSAGMCTAIGVDATHVYWWDTDLDQTSVLKRVPRAGGSPEVLTPTPFAGVNSIAVNATHIYWLAYAIFRMPLAGGDPEEIGPLAAGPSGMTLDATHVYVTNVGQETAPGSGFTNGTVTKVPLDGGDVVTLATDQSCATAPAVDAESVYYVTGCLMDNGRIMKVPLAGGAPVELARKQNMVYHLAIDATSVYWVNNYGPNEIRTVPPAGGEVSTLTVDVAIATIVPDATHLYWGTVLATTDENGNTVPAGAVRRIPLAGGAVEELATGMDSPWVIALADTMIYWGNAGDGVIYALAK